MTTLNSDCDFSRPEEIAVDTTAKAVDMLNICDLILILACLVSDPPSKSVCILVLPDFVVHKFDFPEDCFACTMRTRHFLADIAGTEFGPDVLASSLSDREIGSPCRIVHIYVDMETHTLESVLAMIAAIRDSCAEDAQGIIIVKYWHELPIRISDRGP